MKIKMKLLLLCAAVAPFLMMTSSQQNGSRFGCVCAFEKFPKSGIVSGENCSSSSHQNENAPAPALAFCDKVPANLIEIFNQNMKILKQYALENDTHDYDYLEPIIFMLVKGNSSESFKNQLEEKAVDWLDFCFLSAILEGFLAARNQNFEPMEPYIRKEFSNGFPFAELKKLTCSMWTQLKSIGFKISGFYRGLAYFMHCLESKCFYDFICCLANVHSPYMQLFIACLMNFAYYLDSVVDWVNLINTMYNNPDRLDSDDGVKSILSCFHFEEDLRKELLRFISAAIKKIKVFFVEKCEDLGVYYMVLWFSRLGCFDEVDDIGEVSSFVDEFIENIDDLDQNLDQLYSNCIVF